MGKKLDFPKAIFFTSTTIFNKFTQYQSRSRSSIGKNRLSSQTSIVDTLRRIWHDCKSINIHFLDTIGTYLKTPTFATF